MKPVAWIGLGLVGLPMAARLAAAGWRVAGVDISPERRSLAAARGIAVAASLKEALEGASFVFTSLPSEQVLLEVAGSLPRGTNLVDTSTVGPASSAKVAERLGPYVRAPISGSTALAETGTLTVFASGPRGAYEAALPALKAYSRAQFWLGEGDEARYAKLAVNLMVAVTAGMMGEALAFARKGGIRWESILEVVGESVVGSPLVKYKLDPLRRRDFTPAATNALMMKDLDLLMAAAEEAGVPLPLARHMQELYRRALASDIAGEDFFSVIKLSET
jgi:3-hydroxyisobutyrate dehydrogenase-like beta-hydroxyacid dehydrogenase